jgi:hypothetical protein
MNQKIKIINIKNLLNTKDTTQVGLDQLTEILSQFSCPQNPDVEHFLKYSARDFAKKDQAVTYLVFSSSGETLLGFFYHCYKSV